MYTLQFVTQFLIQLVRCFENTTVNTAILHPAVCISKVINTGGLQKYIARQHFPAH